MYTGYTLDATEGYRVKESGLRIRVEGQLREDFLRVCKKEDLTAAQVLRAFMRTYVERRMRGQQVDLFSETEMNVLKFGQGK
ncbi:antitoxin component of RelBE/YafQ-DinJ toxin-antitoxin module [Edaphobacter lichenicola]|uniref:Antitoxin component of RelBE/YafQ-DinJ toxin-antitoxin module n=1 Tax=Tunturiibacter empetritectus TaxID=3069691 RepID=A0A7W8IJC6_9BACT|nr:antitoxin component of RelBE/YafQ-DinJ toxin-antitoxin module [Edaphobacter lichenicola]